MKRPLAYITAAWLGGDSENAELAAQYLSAGKKRKSRCDKGHHSK